MNGASAAFFTPSGLALDLALMAGCGGDGVKVLDLCAGIGCLGLAAWWRSNRTAEVTCVEVNPDYVAVGKKLFPEANWICASVDDLPAEVRRGGYTVALANPPFGSRAKIKGPRFSGEDALAVVDIASRLASRGGFILPVGAVPFVFNGGYYREKESEQYRRFNQRTGVELTCESIDCAFYADQWKGVRPNVEAVTCDFDGSNIAQIVTGAGPLDSFWQGLTDATGATVLHCDDSGREARPLPRPAPHGPAQLVLL